jgi:hypothetical protein
MKTEILAKQVKQANLASLAVQPTQEEAPQASVLTRLVKEDSGATTLEWGLLLAAIALPSFFILQACLGLLVDHYRMTTTLLALPLP